MTYFEAIRGMNEEALAKFIMGLETGINTIPKRYSCDEEYCHNCKEHLSCYKHYLNQEVQDYRDICDEKTNDILTISMEVKE